jgi:uncharacterized coiled-coil protein SlyX
MLRVRDLNARIRDLESELASARDCIGILSRSLEAMKVERDDKLIVRIERLED